MCESIEEYSVIFQQYFRALCLTFADIKAPVLLLLQYLRSRLDFETFPPRYDMLFYEI
jgi:hypothetical protein